MFRAILVVTLLALSSCGPLGDAPRAECARAGDQCRLSDGLLGVCSDTDGVGSGAAACAHPPCLRCTSQH